MALVSGLVQMGQYEKRRKFIQAFFLAPQNSGYYILNDLFHYVDEEYFCNPDVLAQSGYENLTKPQIASETGTIWFSFFPFLEKKTGLQ
jgi:Nuclear transport factor 2 (NTF2) domain